MRDESVQAFEQYLYRRSPDRRTPVDYVSDVHQFVAVCSKPWREVTMHDIDHFVDSQRQAGLSGATVKRRVAALKVFFDFLAEESGDLAWANPVRSKRHAGKQPKRLPRDLNNETVEQVWAAIDPPRDRAWFVLMLRSGLRVGEIIDLKLDDLLTPPVDDQPARLRVYGKGRKERVVLLNADAYAILAHWLAARPTSDQPYVFLNDRGHPLTVNGIEWLLHRYGTQAGVDLTPHQLRHTFARQLTEAGMPLPSLSKLMGHTQVTTTQIYTAGADPGLAEAYQSAIALIAEPQALPVPAIEPTAQPTTITSPVLPLPALSAPPLPDWTDWAAELPAEIRQTGLDYLQRCLPNWIPRRRRNNAERLLFGLRHFWTWQMVHRPIGHLSQLTLTDLRAYQSAELARGVMTTTINRRLAYVLAVIRAQADEGYPVDPSLFRWRPGPRPESLPRPLNDGDYLRLEAYLRTRLTSTDPVTALENALFFVLAHSGLRACECLDVQYQDLDLSGQRLLVRQGKGRRDRLVYLSPIACQALAQYLNGFRRPAEAALWTKPDGTAVDYTWLRVHLSALGQAVAVSPLSSHRLRHTLATRLLNAGMDITRIQKLLGHERLATTQIYARIADSTVEADYRKTMHRISCQQMPFSDVPRPVEGWPAPQPTNISVELDNSV